MSELEHELRAALRRQEPPAGFAARVVARTQAARPRSPRRWIGFAIAASLLLSAGLFEYRQYQGRKAARELLFALELAGNKIKIAHQTIDKLSRRTIHE